MKRGEYLMNLIEEKGFNVMSLSKSSGVAYTTIRSMIERDLVNASIDNVLKICKVLGVRAEQLTNPEDYADGLNEADDKNLSSEYHKIERFARQGSNKDLKKAIAILEAAFDDAFNSDDENDDDDI